jgi:hypothetical protein
MRVLLALVSLIYGGNIWADGLGYHAEPTFDKPTRIAILELTSAFSQQGLMALDNRKAGHLDWIAVDQIFVSKKMNQTVFVKMGLAPSEKNKFGQLLKIPAGTLYHARTVDGDAVAFLFDKFSDDEIKKIIEKLPLKKSSSLHGMFNLLIPQADAESLGDSAPAANEISMKNPLTAHLLIAMGAAACSYYSWRGAKEAAAGTWDSAKQLLQDPGAYWSSVKAKYSEFQELVSNVNTEMEEFVDAVSKIDKPTALQVACTIAGQTAFSELLSATGVGASKGVANLARILLQLKKARKLVEALAKARAATGKTTENIHALISGVMRCG